eukprot:Sdes_comp19603_c0_seq2m11338
MSEIEETLKRIQTHKGVVGIVILNAEGIPIRTTVDNAQTVQYAALITQLHAKARSCVRDLDPQNELTFLRIRSKKHEIMIAPGNFPHSHPFETPHFYLFSTSKKPDKEYLLIVIQNPTEA